jgi:predicted nucleic acid-binding protein
MPAVSNTSPILNLAIVGHLSCLHRQFEHVSIPLAVRDELRVEEDLPGCHAVREAIAAGWLRVEEARNHALVSVLQRELDTGEAEAIALAVQQGAEVVLMDEREGRRIAKSLGLKVAGVLGILLRAKHEGHLESVHSALAQLQAQVGFRIAPDLLAHVLREAGEG